MTAMFAMSMSIAVIGPGATFRAKCDAERGVVVRVNRCEAECREDKSVKWEILQQCVDVLLLD